MDSLVGMGSMASAAFGAFAIFRMGWGMGHGDWHWCRPTAPTCTSNRPA